MKIIAIGLFIFWVSWALALSEIMKKTYLGRYGKRNCTPIRNTSFCFIRWVDWLKTHPEKSLEIIPEMEADLQRLEQISRRFSSMGLKSDFENLDLSDRIERIVNYLNLRLPSLGKTVELVNDIQPGVMINANGSLLAWSIENIIRNGIDAIDRDDGKVSVTLREKKDVIKIRIIDNGKRYTKKRLEEYI